MEAIEEKSNRLSKMIEHFLKWIESIGNAFPSPAVLFVYGLVGIIILSFFLSFTSFETIDPRTQMPLEVKNLLSSSYLIDFTSRIITIFSTFPPLGITLVMMMGVGVFEHSGFMRVVLHSIVRLSAKKYLTPLLSLMAIVSHVGGDASYVLAIPFGGLLFHTFGRHPIAGIAVAFASVSGALCANLIPSPVDPVLQSLTESAARIINPSASVNPLCNYYFSLGSSVLIVLLIWIITDRYVEPHLLKNSLSIEDENSHFQEEPITNQESKALRLTGIVIVGMILALIFSIYPDTSAWRGPQGNLTSSNAPLMKGIVPLFALFFGVVGITFGYSSGRFQESKDVINGMKKSTESLTYYIIMIFFCSLFVDAFASSNLGIFISVRGAEILKGLTILPSIKLVGLILMCSIFNLFLPSVIAKWTILAPIVVPMLMELGITPELTQAAYRIGDSTTNIITPLNPYFALVLVYCQGFVKEIKAGTILSIMMTYSIVFLCFWSLFLVTYWALGFPLGIGVGVIH